MPKRHTERLPFERIFRALNRYLGPGWFRFFKPGLAVFLAVALSAWTYGASTSL